MKTNKNTQATHTPGPWKAQKPRGHQHAIDRKWEIVAPIPNSGGEMVVVGEHTGIECLNEANARLIAAAPDLLAALSVLMSLHDNPLSKEVFAVAISKARAAIAKAKDE